MPPTRTPGGDPDWDTTYRALRRWTASHGTSTALPDTPLSGSGISLAAWAQQQRDHCDTLTTYQRARLQALPGWTWHTPPTPPRRTWRQKYALVRAYADIHGHVRMPADHVTADGFGLGAWLQYQRWRGRYHGSRSGLSTRCRDLLEALPGWTWDTAEARARDPHAGLTPHFRTRLHLLRVYADTHGHTHMPREHVTDDGVSLGEWVHQVRFKHARHRLTIPQQHALQQVPGWTWDYRRTLTWDDAYSRLVQYTRQHGHARVPADYLDPTGFTLGRWVSEQRRNGPAATPTPRRPLTREQVRRLQALPGWVWRVRRPRSR